jgi:hypothetical protein
MHALDPDLLRRATKIEGVIFDALHRRGQTGVAADLGVAESTISAAKSGDIPKVARILAACGLKVVPTTAQCHAPEYMQALRTFARMAMDQPEPTQLDWEK